MVGYYLGWDCITVQFHFSLKVCMLGSFSKRAIPAKSNSKVTKLQVAKGNKNFVALFALISVGFSGLTLLLQMVLVVNVINIAKKPAPSLVQLSNGDAIKVQAIGSQERSLEVVQRFTTESLILLMSWTNELPNSNGENKVVDPGALVKTAAGEKRITTSTFQASFTLSENLRDEMVKLLAEMTPTEVFLGQVKTTLKFQHVTIPTLVEPGKWKVTVIGTLLKYQRGRGDVTKVPFNKELIIQAIDTPALPKDGKFSNELENLIYTIRQAGLEIVSMKDIEPTEIQQNKAGSGTPASTPSSN
jgi:hypothetical protein